MGRALKVLARVQPPLRWDADAAEHGVKYKARRGARGPGAEC